MITFPTWSDYNVHISSAHSDTQQLQIGAFVHLQSNRIVDGREDWEMSKAGDPPAKDHISVPRQGDDMLLLA